MTDEEINQKRHEALGHTWDESRCRICGWPLDLKDEVGCLPNNCSMRPVPKERADSIPNYCGSLDLVSKAEAFAIEKKGLRNYGMELRRALYADNHMKNMSPVEEVII